MGLAMAHFACSAETRATPELAEAMSYLAGCMVDDARIV